MAALSNKTSSHPDVLSVAQALIDRTEDIAVALLGEPSSRSRREYRYGRRGSLALSLIGLRRGHYTDFERSESGDMLDLLAREYGVSLGKAIAIAQRDFLSSIILGPAARIDPPPRGAMVDEDDGVRVAAAQRLWHEARPIAGTLAHKYFTDKRSLDIDALAAGVHADVGVVTFSHALRWHAGVQAIIAKMSDPLSGEFVGVHRTFLDVDGAKTERKMLGRQGVIRLSPDDAVTMSLGITEGIEDGLAVLLSGWAPVWATTSAGALAKFQILSGVTSLTIFADADIAGKKSADACRDRWAGAGREVIVAAPGEARDMTDFKDWNEAYAGGQRAREAADYIWADAQVDAAGSNSSGVSSFDKDTTTAGPDMSILRRNQMPAPRFPLEVLGPVADWVEITAESKAAPVDYVALSLLVTTAGVIGSKLRISPWPEWDEPSILWGAMVGPPSVSKSPSSDPTRDAVRTVERGINRDWEQKLAKFETDKKTADAYRAEWEQGVAAAVGASEEVPPLPAGAAEPEQPTQHRLWVVDSTTEKLAQLLGENPGGLICYRDELSGLLGGFDKYGGNGTDRAFWLEAYGGRPYRYDRVKNDAVIDIEFCAVSLLGAIQPDRLARFVLSGDDDGFAARILYAWPDPVPSRRPTRTPNHHSLLEALQRLAAIDFVPGEGDGGGVRPRIVALEAHAVDEFQAWWERTQWDAKQAVTGRVAGAVGKLDGITLRLALVLEFLGWAWRQCNTPEPERISMISVLNAIKLIELWVRPTLERVFSEAAIPQVQQDAMVIARWLLKQRRDCINARDLRRLAGFPGPKDAKRLDAAIELLVDAHWLARVPNDEPGRPRKDFTVNPAVYQ